MGLGQGECRICAASSLCNLARWIENTRSWETWRQLRQQLLASAGMISDWCCRHNRSNFPSWSTSCCPKESNVTSFWKEMQHHPRLTKERIRILPPPLGDLKWHHLFCEAMHDLRPWVAWRPLWEFVPPTPPPQKMGWDHRLTPCMLSEAIVCLSICLRACSSFGVFLSLEPLKRNTN